MDDEGKEKRMYPEPLPLLGWDGKEVNEGGTLRTYCLDLTTRTS